MCASHENQLHLEGYTLGEEIGRGASGTVFSAKSTETGRTFAAKRLLIEDTSIREIGVLTQLRKHPNIVEYMESKLGRDGETQVLFVISEFCPLGNIGDYILKQQVDVITKRNLAVQLADAITFLHKNGIVHRDIKPQNVLLTGNEAFLVLKVVDFGLARVLPSPENGANNFDRSYMQSAVGTRFYLSPEIYQSLLNNQPCRYTPSVDIFSLGLLLWAMFDGLSIPGSCQADRYLTPFAGAETDPMPVAQAVTQGNIELNVMEREEILPCKKLVCRMLRGDPKERPIAQNVLSTLVRGYGDYRVKQWASRDDDDAVDLGCSPCLCLDNCQNLNFATCFKGNGNDVTTSSSCTGTCTGCSLSSCCGIPWIIGCLLCYLDRNRGCSACCEGKGMLFVLLSLLITIMCVLIYLVMAALILPILFVLFIFAMIMALMHCICQIEYPEELDTYCELFGDGLGGKSILVWWCSQSPASLNSSCPRLCYCLNDQSGCCLYHPDDSPECCVVLKEIVVSNQVEPQSPDITR
ncbi:serine/threonine-protein kinase pdik1l-B-like [Branchiostoma floridae x Branchiostoma japonicum]